MKGLNSWIYIILGLVLMIGGTVLIIDYIYLFFKVFLGVLMIVVGFWLFSGPRFLKKNR